MAKSPPKSKTKTKQTDQTQAPQDPLASLKEQSIWSNTRTNKGKTKAPALKINNPDSHITFYDAQLAQQAEPSTSLFLGIMPRLDDPYIYIDVDVDPTGEDENKHQKVSKELRAFVKEHPTYVELSPSKNGLHLIYKLGARDHETLRALDFGKVSSTDINLPVTGELIFSKAFLIITETPTKLTDRQLLEPATVALDDLCKIYPKLKQKLLSKTSNVVGIKSRQRLFQAPDIEDLKEKVMQLPASMDYYLTRAYSLLETPMSPNDYDHWVNVCMCLCHAALHSDDEAVHHEYYLLFDEWSQLDQDKYVGPQDTFDKWSACLDTTAQKMDNDNKYLPALTKSTLCRLVNLCSPQYNVRTPKGHVAWESFINLQQALDFHELEFYADAYSSDNLFVKCHKDTKKRLFGSLFKEHPCKEPDYCMLFLDHVDLAMQTILEGSRYPASMIGKCLKTIKPLCVHNIDPEYNTNIYDKFQAWIEATPWDGTPRVQQVIDTLKFDKYTDKHVLEHYHNGLYKCLLWLVGVRFHPEPTSAPCVPILVGKEGIYKSTWVKALMHDTPFARQYVKQVAALLKDRKELSRALHNTLIALIDEIETSMTNADKAKDVLTEETLSIRAHYQNGYVNTMKRGLVFGTTNNPYMSGSDDGNRRLFRITVQQCDTSALWEIDMQQVYAELLHDYKKAVSEGNRMPWVFTKEENAMNNQLMGTAIAQSDDSMLLLEYFGGGPEEFELDETNLLGRSGGLKQNAKLEESGAAVSVKTFMNRLIEHQQAINFNAPIRLPKRNVVRRKLQAFSAKFTHTEHMGKPIGRTVCTNGSIKAKKQELFVIPTLEQIQKLKEEK